LEKGQNFTKNGLKGLTTKGLSGVETKPMFATEKVNLKTHKALGRKRSLGWRGGKGGKSQIQKGTDPGPRIGRVAARKGLGIKGIGSTFH